MRTSDQFLFDIFLNFLTFQSFSCVDKQGILSYPDPNIEKVFFISSGQDTSDNHGSKNSVISDNSQLGKPSEWSLKADQEGILIWPAKCSTYFWAFCYPVCVRYYYFVCSYYCVWPYILMFSLFPKTVNRVTCFACLVLLALFCPTRMVTLMFTSVFP